MGGGKTFLKGFVTGSYVIFSAGVGWGWKETIDFFFI